MEALTAASVAALTVYDMCKAAHKGIVITDIRLLAKSGGKSGDFGVLHKRNSRCTATCVHGHPSERERGGR